MYLTATHRLPKFSTKPKKVYKVLKSRRIGKRECIVTPVQLEEIIFNNHTAELQASLPWYKESFSRKIGASGIHSFATLKAAQECYRWYFLLFLSFQDLVIYPGIIPPFTPYWTDDNGSIASSKLIIYDDPILV